MKKEEIYVVIDNEEKRLRAIKILTDAKEGIYQNSMLFQSDIKNFKLLHFTTNWALSAFLVNKTEITLDQLEELLNPKQEVKMELDALKLIAESYGFELVEKKREIKVGDFGKFESESRIYSTFGFLKNINEQGMLFVEETQGIISNWSNFRHLTDEEKKEITENW